MVYNVSMIDDLKYIHNLDKQDSLGVAGKQDKQLLEKYEINIEKISADNIVVAGMGGSALAASISTSWPGHNRPFQIVRGYDIPDYVNEKTFFIASSYSGNTEETLAALESAEKKQAQIAVITSGGKLAKIAEEKGYPIAKLPASMQPRYAVFYGLKALITLLDKAGLIADKNAVSDLESSAPMIAEAIAGWAPTVPTGDNLAKQIAKEAIGKSIVVYSGPKLSPAGYKWKISFNENAKQVAWVNQYPEFNHNEFIGWSKQPTKKPYTVIDLRSNLENPRVNKRFEVSERLLSGERPAPIKVEAQGDNLLEQLLWIVTLGDFVSLYTALLNGIDPTPVDLIEKLKKLLED